MVQGFALGAASGLEDEGMKPVNEVLLKCLPAAGRK
jgi:hypothetical protein